MLRENARVGLKVMFGRRQGEKTLGEIIKCNPAKAQVKILEQRGRGRGSEVGSVWTVPYSMLEPADETLHPRPPERQVDQPFVYDPFVDAADEHIMDAILCVYADLSPEHLSGDGELSRSHVRQRYAQLQRKLRGLFAALGREVSETVAYKWDEERRKAIAKRAK